jgi:ribosomal-protein-alanine N-acetyltransferase
MFQQRHWRIRATERGDRTAISQLLAAAPWTHLHLDWIDPLDLLDQSPALVLEEFQQPIACLACPPDPEGVSWLRIFAVSNRGTPEVAWEHLWPPAREKALELGVREAGILALHDWIQGPAQASGFDKTHEVIFLKWSSLSLPSRTEISPSIRRMRASDLPQVHSVDRQAFEPIWRNSKATLKQALGQSGYATVLESDDELIGYQISTISPLGGHIARLAISPARQGEGLGRALVRDALEQLGRSGISQITVNTQSDNRTSIELYQRLGFRPTGQRFPVFQKALEN